MSDDQTDQPGSIYSFGETNLATERLRVVSEVFDPISEAFVSEAVGLPDLIYARFLASHLPKPEQAISGWAKGLQTGGLLLLEEVDSISTKVATFEEYLRIVADVLAQHGNKLFVGPWLAAARWDDDLRIKVKRVAEVRPRTGQAARMFSMNLATWRHDPYVEAIYPPDKMEGLATELAGLIGSVETDRIVWQVRQIALHRQPG